MAGGHQLLMTFRPLRRAGGMVGNRLIKVISSSCITPLLALWAVVKSRSQLALHGAGLNASHLARTRSWATDNGQRTADSGQRTRTRAISEKRGGQKQNQTQHTLCPPSARGSERCTERKNMICGSTKISAFPEHIQNLLSYTKFLKFKGIFSCF